MKQKVTILLLFIILLATSFRLFVLEETPLGLYPDEAMNGNNALEALETGKFKIFYPENNGREGLFINLQAISLWIFGNEPWALRVVSALFGTLTILGIYLLAKELFLKNFQFSIFNFQSISNDSIFKNYEIIALLSAFFLATSYWHVNFSRIGFRAIAVPFFAAFGLYFLLKGLRQGSIWNIIWAGVFVGLGFHTYIAFRFMPLVILAPLGWYVWKWRKENQKSTFESRASGRGKIKNQNDPEQIPSEFNGTGNVKLKINGKCILCSVLLFLFVTLVVALPIGWYFLENPQDFLGRSGQVSVFSAASPAKEFLKSNLLTLGMLFVKGDCNWRHNLACQPALHPLVAFFFIIGFISSVYALINPKLKALNSKQITNSNASNHKRFGILNFKNWKLFENCKLKIENLTLLGWLIFMTLPATLTREGLPHALRSIGMTVPVMILAGFGAWLTITKLVAWLEKAKRTFPEIQKKIARIQSEAVFLFIILLVIIPTKTYIDYFVSWAFKPETYFAFSTDILHLGQFLDSKPGTIKKYVIVNLDGVEVKGIPMPAQTVMFATDSFTESKQREKNIAYLVPEDINSISAPPDQKTIITMIKGDDKNLIHTLKEKFPQLKPIAAGDFIVFENKR